MITKVKQWFSSTLENHRPVFWFFLQQIEDLDKSYLEQKGELASLQERLDDLARERFVFIYSNDCFLCRCTT